MRAYCSHLQRRAVLWYPIEFWENGETGKTCRWEERLTSGGLGYKQQLATYSASLGHDPSASSSSASNHGKSYLATFLLLECMWGMMPAWKVNKIAELAVFDGLKHQEIIDIAKLGTNGLYKRNVYRGLVKKSQS